MGRSKIGWLSAPGYSPEVWNVVTGCTPVSEGCANCWAKAMVRRFQHLHCPAMCRSFGEIVLHEDRLADPLHWQKPRMCFVCSMGDLFHEQVPDEFLDKVFARMAVLQKHRFIVLTKRAERMLAYISSRSKSIRFWREAGPVGYAFDWNNIPLVQFPLPNLWLGVSVEDQRTADERIPLLLQTPAAVRFVSVEPMLHPIQLPDCNGRSDCILDGIDGHSDRPLGGLNWVIIGCESGPHRRPCNPQWISNLIQQCDCACVPVFVKQIADYDGRVSHDPAEWPAWARRQEWPRP